jgi:hypothetical protein
MLLISYFTLFFWTHLHFPIVCQCMMLELALISYEHVPKHLIGPTSGNFILSQESISVATLAGFRLISFPPLINKETLNGQVHHLVSLNDPDTELQNEVLQCVVSSLLAILQHILKSCLKGSLPNSASIAYEGHYLLPDMLDIWMVLAVIH